MSERFDVVVIGGGHNGLTTACLLAAQGKQVAVVEQREGLGGLAESVEFEKGFRSAGVWHGPGNVSKETLAAIGLRDLTLQDPPMSWALGESGFAVPFAGPMDRTAFAIAQRLPAEGKNYARYRNFLQRVRPVIERFLTRRPLNLLDVEHEAPMEVLTRALGLRMLGAHDMIELLRVAPMPVRDFLDEHFEMDVLKAALSFDALLGTFTAPRSPGTTLNQLVTGCMTGATVRGGNVALTEALVSRARSQGVRMMTGSAVERILVHNGAVHGVELKDGMVVEAAAVSASCNPKPVLLDMLPVSALTHTTEHRIANVRCRGTAAQLLLAVDGPVEFRCAPEDEPVQHARIALTPDHVERAFDAVKYGRFHEEPVLDITVPSIDNPSLAPAGKSVVSVLVSYVPAQLDGGWTAAARDTLTRATIASIARFVDGFEARVIAARLSTPADLEADFGLPGGQLHHGEPAIDQTVIRPIPECFNHETPVRGLTLCGSGTHPGGSMSCLAGVQGAQAVLRSMKARAAA
jgi:phytoene dehydrogenase-like protein